MVQNSASGGAAARFGRECGPKLAQLIGATPVPGPSNECTLDGKRMVIKCARAKNRTVGVLQSMIPRLDAVIGAFEVKPYHFELWRLDRERYAELMTPKPARPGTEAQGMVHRPDFEAHGENLGILEVTIDSDTM